MTSRTRNKIADGLNQAIGYTQGWNEAIEAAARVAELNHTTDVMKDVVIARGIRALKYPRGNIKKVDDK